MGTRYIDNVKLSNFCVLLINYSLPPSIVAIYYLFIG